MRVFHGLFGFFSSSSQSADREETLREQTKAVMRHPVFNPQKHPPHVRDALEFVINGGMLTKVRSKRIMKQRFFRVDTVALTLVYTGSTKTRFQSRAGDQSTVYLSKIKEIREGLQSDVFRVVFRNNQNASEISRCFTVLIPGERTLDLIAPDSDSYKLWMSGLLYLIRFLEIADPLTMRYMFVSNLFANADVNSDGVLDLKEILKLLEKMNVAVDHNHAMQICQAAKKFVLKHKKSKTATLQENPNSLTPDEFIAFCNLVERQEEVKPIFKKYDGGTGKLTPKNFGLFLKNEQKMQLLPEDIQEIIETCESCPDLRKKHVLCASGFQSAMRSMWMDIRRVECQYVYQDMNQPLCHYFVNSSHNTYLAQDQLTGRSEVECYVNALRSGIRCIEVDCWDGSNGLPIVYHGFTLTSKISFKDVMLAINKSAFEASEYPVIISVENHCSLSQQKTMAELMRDIFGSKLLTVPLPEGTRILPSPNQLKNKIIIKGKKLSSGTEPEFMGEVSDDDETGEFDDEQVKKGMKRKIKGDRRVIAKEFSDCVVICQCCTLKSVRDLEDKSAFKKVKNIPERRALNLIQNHFQKLLFSNTWQMTRIYPAGTRTNSSNFDPLPFWRAGCQLVAMNSQTPDLQMQVNRALFEDNGGVGYVLKPDFMRNENTEYSLEGPYPPEWRKLLIIEVISGFQLPKKPTKMGGILDPFVKIQIFGVPADTQEVRTKTIEDNGFHPVWNEKFEFVINCPRFAVILFRVFDKDDWKKDKVVAQYGLPMNCIGTGYRTIHLKAADGYAVKAGTLFVHIATEDG